MHPCIHKCTHACMHTWQTYLVADCYDARIALVASPVCVCLCMFVCMYVYVCVRACMHACVHTVVSVCKFLCLCFHFWPACVVVSSKDPGESGKLTHKHRDIETVQTCWIPGPCLSNHREDCTELLPWAVLEEKDPFFALLERRSNPAPKKLLSARGVCLLWNAFLITSYSSSYHVDVSYHAPLHLLGQAAQYIFGRRECRVQACTHSGGCSMFLVCARRLDWAILFAVCLAHTQIIDILLIIFWTPHFRDACLGCSLLLSLSSSFLSCWRGYFDLKVLANAYLFTSTFLATATGRDERNQQFRHTLPYEICCAFSRTKNNMSP